MILKKLMATNWCQHDKLDIEFSNAINGILGPNGSGKSNLIAACKFALIGTADKKNSLKLDEIKYGADKCVLDLTVEIDSKEILIHRELIRDTDEVKGGEANSKITLSNGEEILGTKEVNKYITNVLKISGHILKTIIFVPQGDIDKLLFQSPSERKAEFQKLFGTDNVETIRDILKSELNELDSINGTIANINFKKNERLTHENLEKEHKTEYAAQLQRFNSLSNAGQLAQAVIHKSKERPKLEKEFDTYSNLETQYLANITVIDSDLELYENKLKELLNDQAELKVIVDKFKEEKLLHGSALEAWNKKKSLFARLGQLQIPVPPTVPSHTEDQALEAFEKYNSLMEELEDIKAKIELHEAGLCHTCGQDCRLPESNYRNYCLEKNSKEAYLKDWDKAAILKAIEDARKYKAAFNAYSVELADYKARQHSLLEQLTALENVKEPVFNVNLDEYLEAMAAAEFEISTLTKSINNMQTNLTVYRTKLEEAILNKTAISSELLQLPSQEEITAALELLKEYDAAHRELSLATARVDITEQAIKNLDKEILGLSANLPNIDKLNQYIKYLEQARVLLHKDNLPALITAHFLKKLNVKLAEFLDKFNAVFKVSIDSETNFNCDFPDGMSITSDRLSGGQKICLALATRFAINEIFCNNLGLLVLDEPTAYLDDENIKNVAEVLDSIRSYSKTTGIQLVLVTHDKFLESYFDKTILLENKYQ